MNDHYIFVNKQSLIGGVIRFKFPYNDMSRVPNMSIKLIQGTLGLPNAHLPDGIICKMELPASNYSSDDNTGTTLGIFNYMTHTNSDYGYRYQPMESPSYNINGSNSYIEIGFFNSAGTNYNTVVENINLLFKLSFPKPDELEMDYRSRVPLPSRLI